MIYSVQGQQKKPDQSIDLMLMAQEFVVVAEVLKQKEQIQADLFEKEIDFLTSAREFALGKSSSKGSIPPSEAFAITLKAIAFEKLVQSSLDNVINEIIGNIEKVKSGCLDNSADLSIFFTNLSKVVEVEVKKSRSLDHACFGAEDYYGTFE